MTCILEDTGKRDGRRVLTCRLCGRTLRTNKPASTIVRTCTKPRLDPCQHLGQQTGLRTCTSCRGNTRLKVYACAVHGEATLAQCRTCGDYRPSP